MRKKRAILQAACLATIAGLPAAARSQVSGSWIAPRGGEWSTGSNWTSNPFYPDAGGTAFFRGSVIPKFVNVASTVSLGGIVFGGLQGDSVSGGTIILAEPTTVTAETQLSSGPTLNRTHTLTAILAGTGNLVKEGPGALLVNRTGYYTGGTTVNQGTLVLDSDSALGFGSLILNGGAVLKSSGSLTKSIDVTALGGIIAAQSPSFLTVTSNIQGTGPLRLEGTHTRVSTSGATLNYGMQLDGSVAFAGPLTVHTQVELGGTLNSVRSIEASEMIWMNTSGGPALNRISDSASITLRGGGIVSDPNTPGSGTETVGDVIVAEGINSLGDAKLKFNVGGLSRQNHGILTVGTAGMQVNGQKPALSGSGLAGTPSVGILPWARYLQFESLDMPRPVTLDPSGALRPLNDSEYVTSPPVGSTGFNLRMDPGGAWSISSSVVINSLTLNRPMISYATVSVSSGAVFIAELVSTNPFGGGKAGGFTGTLDFGSTEAIIHGPLWNNTPGTLSDMIGYISGAMFGSGGVTVAGRVVMDGPKSYTGTTRVFGNLLISSDVIPGQPGPLGIDTSPIVIEGGRAPVPNFPAYTTNLASLELNPALYRNPVAFARDLVTRSLGPQPVVIQQHGAEEVTVSGNIDVTGRLKFIGFPSLTNFTISGNITGSGMLLHPSDVILSGNNSFTGGVELNTGPVYVASDTAFGTGPIWIIGNGTISAWGGPRTLSNPIVLQQDARIGGTLPLTFAGPVTVVSTRSLTVLSTSTTTFSDSVSSGTLAKAGTGALVINTTNLAGLRITQGPVQMRQANAGKVASVVRSLSIAVAAGTTLDLTNNDFILDYSGSSSTADTNVRNMLLGALISTSLVDATHGIGYADNTVTNWPMFGGQSVDATSVLFRYTFFGDADLDSDVDASDLAALASHWQSTSQFWTAGDFNYDGTVDIRDLYLLATNWGAGPVAPPGAPLSQALTLLGLPVIEVPETGTIGAVAFCLAVAATRRQRPIAGSDPSLDNSSRWAQT